MTVVYQGFGPDVSDTVAMAAGYFKQFFYQAFTDSSGDTKLIPINWDLLPYFNVLGITDFSGYQSILDPATYAFLSNIKLAATSFEGLPITGIITNLMSSTPGDVDDTIDQILFRAADPGRPDPATGIPILPGVPQATPAQLGRLRALLESAAGLLRGEANGALFTQYDADPTLGLVSTALSSDNVANSLRDGQNEKIAFEIPLFYTNVFGNDIHWGQVEAGSFFLNLTATVTDALTGRQSSINLTGQAEIAGNLLGGVPMDYAGTAASIQATLNQMLQGMATVEVREITPDEINFLLGTGLSIPGINPDDFNLRAGGYLGNYGYRAALYEITFVGALHDVSITSSLQVPQTLGSPATTKSL